MARKLLSGTMIDTETLGLSARALIWEVAAIRFEFDPTAGPEDVEQSLSILSEHHLLIAPPGRLDSAAMKAFDVEDDTIVWTQEQRGDDPAWSFWRDRFLLSQDSAEVPDDLTMIGQDELGPILRGIAGSEPVWFRNAAFDGPVISHHMRVLNQAMPWHRRSQSDIYTMINMARQLTGYEPPPPELTRHFALDDVRAQIRELASVTAEVMQWRIDAALDAEPAREPVF